MKSATRLFSLLRRRLRTASLFRFGAIAAVACSALLASADVPRTCYTIAGGTVYDKRTRLTWQQKLDPVRVAWADAPAYCASLVLDGAGWRVPTLKELQTIVDDTRFDPAIDPVAFPDTPSEHFWTSTEVPGADPAMAFYVDFFNGLTFAYEPSNTHRVRCVR